MVQNTRTIYILKETQEMVISPTNAPTDNNATDHQDVAQELLNNKNDDNGINNDDDSYEV